MGEGEKFAVHMSGKIAGSLFREEEVGGRISTQFGYEKATCGGEGEGAS